MSINFAKPVAGALYLFDKGHKVFPCIPNGKTPATKDWQEWAKTATRRRIEEYGRANPMHNWGVYGEGLLIVDLDTKENKNGFESLKQLLANTGQNMPDTFTVSTPSKGAHHYFMSDAGRPTVGLLGPGIDTRGAGSYVIAPGSRIGEAQYEIKNEMSPFPAPAWLMAKLNEKKKAEVVPEVILEGERNKILASIAGTMRRRGLGYDAIYCALQVVNSTQLESPLADSEVETIARSVANYAPEVAEAAADFLEVKPAIAKTLAQITTEHIAARDWIMQDRYMGGFISVLVAPGGVGKSTLSTLDAIAIASGKNLTGFRVVSPGAVWIYNTEDPTAELERRFWATCIHHGLKMSELGAVHFTSGRDQPLVLAKAGRDGVAVNTAAIEQCVHFIRENKIKLMIVDPFVHCHEVNENDNMQMSRVVMAFSTIANRTGCAIGIVHHSRKPGAEGYASGNADAARGASALVNAARIAHTLLGMTEKEALEFGVEPDKRGWYMRLDNAKANMQAPAENATWFEKISVTLPNGDDVGTIEVAKITEGREERKKEALQANSKDVARALAEIMTHNQELSALDAFTLISTNPKFSHLIGAQTERKGVPTLINLLNMAPEADGKCFSYRFNETHKQKHYVVCHNSDAPDCVENDKLTPLNFLE